jgi:hypothetical protein
MNYSIDQNINSKENNESNNEKIIEKSRYSSKTNLKSKNVSLKKVCIFFAVIAVEAFLVHTIFHVAGGSHLLAYVPDLPHIIENIMDDVEVESCDDGYMNYDENCYFIYDMINTFFWNSREPVKHSCSSFF